MRHLYSKVLICIFLFSSIVIAEENRVLQLLECFPDGPVSMMQHRNYEMIRAEKAGAFFLDYFDYSKTQKDLYRGPLPASMRFKPDASTFAYYEELVTMRADSSKNCWKKLKRLALRFVAEKPWTTWKMRAVLFPTLHYRAWCGPASRWAVPAPPSLITGRNSKHSSDAITDHAGTSGDAVAVHVVGICVVENDTFGNAVHESEPEYRD